MADDNGIAINPQKVIEKLRQRVESAEYEVVQLETVVEQLFDEKESLKAAMESLESSDNEEPDADPAANGRGTLEAVVSDGEVDEH